MFETCLEWDDMHIKEDTIIDWGDFLWKVLKIYEEKKDQRAVVRMQPFQKSTRSLGSLTGLITPIDNKMFAEGRLFACARHGGNVHPFDEQKIS